MRSGKKGLFFFSLPCTLRNHKSFFLTRTPLNKTSQGTLINPDACSCLLSWPYVSLIDQAIGQLQIHLSNSIISFIHVISYANTVVKGYPCKTGLAALSVFHLLMMNIWVPEKLNAFAVGTWMSVEKK